MVGIFGEEKRNFFLRCECLNRICFGPWIGSAVKSSILTVVRTMVLFVPLGYLFSRFGLQYFWLTFPVTEVLTTLVGFKFYRSQQA